MYVEVAPFNPELLNQRLKGWIKIFKNNANDSVV
jgi:hypothetical protein